jgi:hypothetical protein
MIGVTCEAVILHRNPSQPNPGYNEADGAISARLEGKKCRFILRKYREQR